MGQERSTLKIALIGNPNCGKTSVFNRLTGLQQKVGNFPGVTVEKKAGQWNLPDGRQALLIDFPGTYSFYPTSKDEKIVVQTLANPSDDNYPDLIIYVADVVKLEKHLLLFTQIKDLGIPSVLALNMADVAEQDGIEVDTEQLAHQLDTTVISISGRTGFGIDKLSDFVVNQSANTSHTSNSVYSHTSEETTLVQNLEPNFSSFSAYQRLLLGHHYPWLPFLTQSQRGTIAKVVEDLNFKTLPAQVHETMQRYDTFTPIAQSSISRKSSKREKFTDRVDNLLTHRIFCPLLFFLLMLLVFQSIFTFASYPMDGIDFFFGYLTEQTKAILPAGWFSDLLTDGLLAGLGGVLIFIPQIAILFLLISILEEVGYMARAAFMFDRLMQAFGLNGRSIVALISGGACAIPAVMSTRTIGNWKERLITILVTPFISCSARIPVYTVLIAFAVPSNYVFGIFNLQGLAFMGLYILGIIAALGAAFVLKIILKSQDASFLMLELPEYRMPVARNVVLTVWDKVKTFTVEAGQVILVISLLLWVLSSYGPNRAMQEARTETQQIVTAQGLDQEAAADLLASRKLEASYAGHLGKFMEPAITPLGFDWKIGIALITSFAAREVFVGTMATIYSIGSTDDEFSIKNRMSEEVNPATGEKVYNTATSWSLLVFYVFAMQCMSTLAVVKRETHSWKWPTIQFFMMSGLAYVSSLIVYQWLA
ncbi:MAG: ferrous iron transport protein B [Saprospiraceae bacterium]|nr:ferrous iron transport protein B [Saprospiraceae bacterium]